MRKVKFEDQTKLMVNNIKGFMKRKVVISGTSAKVNCPKEYLGYDACLIIFENGIEKEGARARKSTRRSSSDNRRAKRKS